jgi:uncharacterized protein
VLPTDKTLPAPDPTQLQVIRTYGPGRFLIGEREWRQPVLVTASFTEAWDVTAADKVAPGTLAPLRKAAAPIEFLVLGCGPRSLFITPDIRAALKSIDLALEVLDTGSACRTYNVLLAEGRRVAAALIPL